MTPEKFSNPPEKPMKTPEKVNVDLGGHPVANFNAITYESGGILTY